MSMIEEAELCRIRFELLGDKLPASYHGIDAAFAAFLKMSHLINGRTESPKRATFVHDCFGELQTYQDIFQCPIEFNAPYNELVIDRSFFDATIIVNNPEVSKMHEKLANDYLTIHEGGFKGKVKQVIVQLMKDGEPQSTNVAAKLNISTRTLQRRLNEIDTSFKTLLDQVREELAIKYLSRDNLSAAEVTYLLGFSDPSNFYRAFKRWRGMTPGEYKESLQGDDGN